MQILVNKTLTLSVWRGQNKPYHKLICYTLSVLFLSNPKMVKWTFIFILATYHLKNWHKVFQNIIIDEKIYILKITIIKNTLYYLSK